MMGSAHMLSKEKITHKEQKVNKTEFSVFLYSAFFFLFYKKQYRKWYEQQFDSVAFLVKQHGIWVHVCWTIFSETSAFFLNAGYVEPEITLSSNIRCTYF